MKYRVNWKGFWAVPLTVAGGIVAGLFLSAGLTGPTEGRPAKYLDLEVISARLPYDLQDCQVEAMSNGNVLAVCRGLARFAVVSVRPDGTALVRVVALDGSLEVSDGD